MRELRLKKIKLAQRHSEPGCGCRPAFQLSHRPPRSRERSPGQWRQVSAQGQLCSCGFRAEWGRRRGEEKEKLSSEGCQVQSPEPRAQSPEPQLLGIRTPVNLTISLHPPPRDPNLHCLPFQLLKAPSANCNEPAQLTPNKPILCPLPFPGPLHPGAARAPPVFNTGLGQARAGTLCPKGSPPLAVLQRASFSCPAFSYLH